jgi:hypothetical protein
MLLIEIEKGLPKRRDGEGALTVAQKQDGREMDELFIDDGRSTWMQDKVHIYWQGHKSFGQARHRGHDAGSDIGI